MYYYLLALIAGAALTAQVGVNGRLLVNLGSPVLTSFFSFLIGTIGLGTAYVIAAYNGLQSVPTSNAFAQTNVWMWLGGLIGAFYIFTVIVCAPKIGFANMFSLVVAGQILLAIICDHFGLFGSHIHLLTPMRFVGVALLVVGVYIIQNN